MAELSRKARDWGLKSKKGNPVSNQTMHDLIQNPFYYGMMKVRGQLQPHVYKPIISKQLFDTCDTIRNKRGRTQACTETKHPFLLRGLVTCAVSGRKAYHDLKKGKHVYLITRDPNKSDKQIWTNEKIVMDQIRDVFKSIQIPPAVLNEILSHLKMTHEAEQNYHAHAIEALTRQSTLVTKRLDSLMTKFLDESITKDMYDRTHAKLIQERQDINRKLEEHHAGDEKFRIALTTLVTLASKAHEIFECSQIEEKRQLIGYVFANLKLNGAKLQYTLNKPFDMFVNLGSYQEWLPGRSRI
jgi:site-specific DNA recombinase